MFNVFALLPLPLFIIGAYLLNRTKYNLLRSKLILLSLSEGILVYLFSYMFFFEGFLSYPYEFGILLFLFFLIALYVTKYGHHEESADVQSETMKNLLVIFLTTFLPFYIFLTMFRFQPTLLQLLYSILCTTGFFILSLIAKGWFEKLLDWLSLHLYNAVSGKFWLAWGTAFLIIVIAFFFDFPTRRISYRLNLSDRVSYFTYDGFPTTLKNRFQAKETVKLKIDEEIRHQILDFYCDDSYLYFYTSDDTIYIYNYKTEKLHYKNRLSTIEKFNLEEDAIINKFVFFDNYLILKSLSGTYIITPDGEEKIADFRYGSADFFYHNDNLYILERFSAQEVEIYKFESGKFTFIDRFNYTQRGYQDILVISNHLFYHYVDDYYLYFDENVHFRIKNGFPTYDAENQLMYYVVNPTYKGYSRDRAIYYQVDSNNQVKTFEAFKYHNSKGIVINGYVFFTDKDDDRLQRIEVMNHKFTFDSIHRYIEEKPFFFTNKYTKRYIANFRQNRGYLEYLQVSKNSKRTSIIVRELREEKLGLELPFYSHYGLFTFVPILIAFVTPITNYQKTLTIIGFEQNIVNRKREKQLNEKNQNKSEIV